MSRSTNPDDASTSVDGADKAGNGGLTRRRFAAGAGATTLAAAGARLLGGPAESDAKQIRRHRPKRADVVVVGAGPAGLAAARKIVAAGKSVVVLEARERAGGRIKNWYCGMPPACDCAQSIAPSHTRTRKLLQQFELHTYPQHAVATGQGNDVLYVDGERLAAPAGGPLPSETGTFIFTDGTVPLRELDQMAASVPPDAPWEASRATEWDAMTTETWKQQNTVTPTARVFIDFLVFLVGQTNPNNVSLLHTLSYLARLGDGKHGTEEALDFIFKSDYVLGGLQQLPDRIARALGRRVIFESPVRRIVQCQGRVRVESDKANVLAKQVIIATAPALNALIDFRPGLPQSRAQLLERYPQGLMYTFSAIYKRPWWRDKGLTGRAIGLDPMFSVTDYSPPDNSSGRLCAFAFGQSQLRLARLPAAQRRRTILSNLAQYLGEEARHPLVTLERNWCGSVTLDAPWVDNVQGQWTRGCPGYLGPGVWTSFGPWIREPFGRVHFANSEHSTSFNTYVEGAIRSAEAVAGQVLADL